MANEVAPTKDIRARPQAPCACKDKQHMQALECVLLCECFSSAFCKILQGIIFFPLSWLRTGVEFSTVWVWSGCYSMPPMSLLGTRFQHEKLGLPFGIWLHCLCSLHAGMLSISSLSGKTPRTCPAGNIYHLVFIPSGEYLFAVKYLLF